MAIIKRISAIGSELVELERRRNEIDTRTKALIREAHRLTRPRGATDGDGEVTEPKEVPALPIVNGAAHLVRNGEPTIKSRVLGWLHENDGRAMTKWEGAQALNLTTTQVHYCLVGLQKQGLLKKAGMGRWMLTERGKEQQGKLPAARNGEVIVVNACAFSREGLGSA